VLLKKYRFFLPVVALQKTAIGSSPTLDPSGSISYIPDSMEGLDVRASKQDLGKVAVVSLRGEFKELIKEELALKFNILTFVLSFAWTFPIKRKERNTAERNSPAQFKLVMLVE